MARDYPVSLDTAGALLFVTDTHLGRRAYTATQLEVAGADIDKLVPHVSGVAVGGDLIHWGVPGSPEDAQWKAWFAARNKAKPWARVAGKHDMNSFASPYPTRTATQWLAAIGETGQNQAIDCGQFRVLAVSPDMWNRIGATEDPMALSQSTIDWLSAQLAADSRPTWLVSHVPLPQQYSGHMATATATALNTVIGQNTHVIGWLSGHRHADIRNDLNHAQQLTVGGRRIAGINGPPAGGQVNGTTVDPWDSPLWAMVLSYTPGQVVCRWRNLLTRSWDTHAGVRTKTITIDA
ncbi:metallophosphoesterase family protein [Acinetobacter pragensis]|uniref:metallophosphoesterase family protein n=1 Tax=Acinetobacter pragensis TaxID=1806892 RepID=UPI0033422D68